MPPLPTIPETITVHLGAPDSAAMNVTETFPDYIKNVASSEIYPTWPDEAIKANVLAQISVALNRVYTNYYRRRGYDFDITNSPAYDQTYIYGRDIFQPISQIVDEIFNSYIRRDGAVEPLFAQFCDGVEVICDGLQQWESVELANQGLTYQEIIREAYGNDIEIVTDVETATQAAITPSTPLREGDTGQAVEIMQIRLNRISSNFPGIPKIPSIDGFFGEATTNAVTKFQEVFNLTQDGIVGIATWNRINAIYAAVKKLSSINSEGLTLEELQTTYPGQLEIGAEGSGVYTVQYYLAYISLFILTVQSPIVDGSFGEGTRDSVVSFQRSYNLPTTGIVDEVTWRNIEDTYFNILEGTPYRYDPGIILPFPGRVLRIGVNGNDVVALQEYLNYISNTYNQITPVTVDGDYGQSTANAVREFKELFNIPGNPERVDVQTWQAIISVYDDLYVGAIVNDEQFPGFGI